MTVKTCVCGPVCSDKAVLMLSAIARSEDQAYKFVLISTNWWLSKRLCFKDSILLGYDGDTGKMASGLLTEHSVFIIKTVHPFKMMGICKPVKRPYVPKEQNPQPNHSTNLRSFRKPIEHTCRYLCSMHSHEFLWLHFCKLLV